MARAYLADDVHIAPDCSHLVLHNPNLLEESLHVLALAGAAATAFEICICDGFADAEFTKAVHHLIVAAVVFAQQRISVVRNFGGCLSSSRGVGEGGFGAVGCLSAQGWWLSSSERARSVSKRAA